MPAPQSMVRQLPTHLTILLKLHAAHTTLIFDLEVTDTQVITVGASTDIKVHSTTEPGNPLVQVIEYAHSNGCHQVAIDAEGTRMITAGFNGIMKVWSFSDGSWVADKDLTGRLQRPRLYSKLC